MNKLAFLSNLLNTSIKAYNRDEYLAISVDEILHELQNVETGIIFEILIDEIISKIPFILSLLEPEEITLFIGVKQGVVSKHAAIPIFGRNYERVFGVEVAVDFSSTSINNYYLYLSALYIIFVTRPQLRELLFDIIFREYSSNIISVRYRAEGKIVFRESPRVEKLDQQSIVLYKIDTCIKIENVLKLYRQFSECEWEKLNVAGRTIDDLVKTVYKRFLKVKFNLDYA